MSTTAEATQKPQDQNQTQPKPPEPENQGQPAQREGQAQLGFLEVIGWPIGDGDGADDDDGDAPEYDGQEESESESPDGFDLMSPGLGAGLLGMAASYHDQGDYEDRGHSAQVESRNRGESADGPAAKLVQRPRRKTARNQPEPSPELHKAAQDLGRRGGQVSASRRRAGAKAPRLAPIQPVPIGKDKSKRAWRPPGSTRPGCPDRGNRRGDARHEKSGCGWSRRSWEVVETVAKVWFCHAQTHSREGGFKTILTI